MVWLSALLERLRGAMQSPLRRMRRDGRAIQRDVSREHEQSVAGAEAEKRGSIEGVTRASDRFTSAQLDETRRLFDQLRQMRLLLLKEIKLLGYIVHAVQADTLDASEKQRLHKRFTEARDAIIKFVEDVFRSETSFESINASLTKMLDDSSLARDEYYRYLSLRKPANNTIKGEKQLLRAARSLSQEDAQAFEKNLDAFMANLREELKALGAAVQETIQLLQRDEKTAQEREEQFRSLMANEGFPKEYGVKEVQGYGKIIQEIHRLLEEEVVKDRLVLSEAQRAA